MPKLYGTEYSRKQLEMSTGAPWQTGGARRLTFAEGPEAGTEAVQFDTGTGLTFNVLPGRGLDIASAKFCGAPLAFELPAGEARASFFEPEGLGWLRTFFGGLVTTCGMTWAGAPCEDAGQKLGLHGRYTHIPARNVKVGDEWEGETRRLWVSGDVRECVLFGANVLCRRTVSTELGSNAIRIEDRVRNEAFSETPYMMLYHINLGFPVVGEDSELLARSSARPRDAAAEEGKESYNRFEPPAPGYREKVYYHDIQADADGFAHAAIVNPAFGGGRGLGVHVRYRQAELPRFAQWKMMGAGEYVCGLEPANCGVEGRDRERGAGSLVVLQPGEEVHHLVEITVLPDNDSINAVRKVI